MCVLLSSASKKREIAGTSYGPPDFRKDRVFFVEMTRCSGGSGRACTYTKLSAVLLSRGAYAREPRPYVRLGLFVCFLPLTGVFRPFEKTRLFPDCFLKTAFRVGTLRASQRAHRPIYYLCCFVDARHRYAAAKGANGGKKTTPSTSYPLNRPKKKNSHENARTRAMSGSEGLHTYVRQRALVPSPTATCWHGVAQKDTPSCIVRS